MTAIFWISVLLITQAVGFVIARDAFPIEWVYGSVGFGVAGIVLLIVAGQIDDYRNGFGARWRRSHEPKESPGDIED